jgi:glycosyltransferase involved in cell wall biosynthesis
VTRTEPQRTSESPFLSVVVPAYDEAIRIPATLRAISEHFAAAPFAVELIVVDDGSSDATSSVVREVASALALPLRLLRYQGNRGKGFALKVGVAASQGERVLFSDADLSTPIVEADRLLAEMERGFDLAIGTRKHAEARVEVHQPWLRETLGKGFTILVRLLIAPVTDATCGFKAYRGDVARDLFSHMRIFDWSFDAELLLLARRRGHRLVEVPVLWRDQTGTKVDLRRDVLRSLVGIVRIRSNDVRGRYAEPLPLDVVVESWGPPAHLTEPASTPRVQA